MLQFWLGARRSVLACSSHFHRFALCRKADDATRDSIAGAAALSRSSGDGRGRDQLLEADQQCRQLLSGLAKQHGNRVYEHAILENPHIHSVLRHKASHASCALSSAHVVHIRMCTARTSWYPRACVYQDSYTIYVSDTNFQGDGDPNGAGAHPEWILQLSNGGGKAYIPWFACCCSFG